MLCNNLSNFQSREEEHHTLKTTQPLDYQQNNLIFYLEL